MATVLKIYKTEITPARNARVDSIDTYLAKCGAQYIDSNFQFIKPQLDMTINIDISSWDYSYITDRGNASLYPVFGNYLTLDLDTGASSKLSSTMRYYYFILEARWVSDETVALKCSLDTINTFWDDFHWSDKTSITREHVDRFVGSGKVGNLTEDRTPYIMKVDKNSEGISPVEMLKYHDFTVTQPNSPNTAMDWYLMYKTDNDAYSNATSGTSAATNGLNCYLLPDNSYPLKQAGTATEFTLNLNNYSVQNRHYFFMGESGATINFSLTSTADTYGTSEVKLNGVRVTWNISNVKVLIGDSFTADGNTVTCIGCGIMRVNCYGIDWLVVVGIYFNPATNKYCNGYFYNNNRVFFVYDHTGYSNYVSDASFDPRTQCTYGSVSDLFGNDGFDVYRGADYWMDLRSIGTSTVHCDQAVTKVYQNTDGSTETDKASIEALPVAYDNGTASIDTVVPGYNSLADKDLADSKLVKILELPYCPCDITEKSDGSYELNSYFKYDSINKTLKYTNLRQGFQAKLASQKLNQFIGYLYGTALYRVFLRKNQLLEPKLYHSDFYTYKFVYDGAYKQIKFENISPYWAITKSPEIDVTFKQTNTIGSSLAFWFDFAGTDTAYRPSASYSSSEDYPVLLSSRDNSLPIYNNDFINYMRYTYASDRANIDATQKAKETSIGIGIGSTAAGLVGGAAMGFAAGNVAGAAIGAIVGAATGIMSTINAAQQADTNIANANRSLTSKMENLRNQPVTASGAAGAVDIMKAYSSNKLHVMTYVPTDLFKKALYDKLFYCGYAHPVQDIPDFTSRFWFNYVQCDPVFKGETLVYNKYLDDIKARFKIGVTDYHMHNLVTQYDWDQQYENWETRLVDGAEVVGHTYISGEFVTNTTGGVDMNISSSQDASLFTWTYLDENSTPVAINWSSTNKFNTTVHFDSYPGPTLVIATYKADTSKTSDGEIDWP